MSNRFGAAISIGRSFVNMSEDTNAKKVPDTEKMEVDSTVPDADAKSTENGARTATEKPEIKEELDGKYRIVQKVRIQRHLQVMVIPKVPTSLKQKQTPKKKFP